MWYSNEGIPEGDLLFPILSPLWKDGACAPPSLARAPRRECFLARDDLAASGHLAAAAFFCSSSGVDLLSRSLAQSAFVVQSPVACPWVSPPFGEEERTTPLGLRGRSRRRSITVALIPRSLVSVASHVKLIALKCINGSRIECALS